MAVKKDGTKPDKPGVGIKTNGVGKRFDGHLNRTRTMEADFEFFERNGHIPFSVIRSWRLKNDAD